ncbi:hypothetical protein DFJ73DRAFT_365824 [Zopfochytrium polystomum]|nr:hypothetical protein DFJ73DRAFT_365824 [Zopfochytrium polystomum]
MTDVRPAGASRGRGLFATRRYPAGTQIATETPVITIPDDLHLNTHCARCFAAAGAGACTSLSQCAACKHVRYCSTGCQRADWPQHKAECRTIVAARPRRLTAAMRAVVRLWTACRSDPAAWEAVAALESHRDRFAPDAVETFAQMAMLLGALGTVEVDGKGGSDGGAGLGELGQPPRGKQQPTSAADLLGMFCRFSTNSMAVGDGEMVNIGVSVPCRFAMMNHSCWPNAVIVFRGPVATLRALRDIEEGEELTQSYLEIADEVVKRRAELSSRYFFDCACELCSRQAAEPAALGRCPQCKTGFISGAITTATCSNCGAVSPETFSSVRVRIEALRERVQEADAVRGRLEKIAALAKELEDLVPEGSPLLLQARRKHLEACLAAKDWGMALLVSNALCETMDVVYPPLHPLLSVQRFVSAKLMAVMAPSANDEVESAMMDAAKRLSKTHGDGHPIVAEAIAQLNDIQSAHRAP